MKRLLLVFVVALVVGTGVGFGIAFMRAPDQKAAATASTKDSTATPKRDSAQTSAQGVPATQAVAAVAEPSGAQDSAGAKEHSDTKTIPVTDGVASTPTPSDTPHVAATASRTAKVLASNAPQLTSASAADTLLTKRLAKIFAAMPARDAAHVLEQMDDHDVRTILLSLSNKQQAAILGSLPVQRAATIARETLRNTPVASSTP